MRELLDAIDRYLDAAPRPDSDVEEVGPFTLFVGRGPWPYYARPRLGLATAVGVEDVAGLEARCRARSVPLALEWVDELTLSLEPAARSAGLEIERHALLALGEAGLRPVAPPPGVVVEVVGADDPRLIEARATANVGFATSGTAVGAAGPAQRDGELASVSARMRAHLYSRSARGLTVTAVAVDENDGVVASGSLQPLAGAAEIVGVATLPSHRRRGLAAALSTALVRAALAREVSLLLLSAASDPVARVYERVGFERVGTHVSAERPAP